MCVLAGGRCKGEGGGLFGGCEGTVEVYVFELGLLAVFLELLVGLSIFSSWHKS